MYGRALNEKKYQIIIFHIQIIVPTHSQPDCGASGRAHSGQVRRRYDENRIFVLFGMGACSGQKRVNEHFIHPK